MKTISIIALLLTLFGLQSVHASQPVDLTTPNHLESASEGPWALLGKRSVNFSLDHDEVLATGQGLFTGIKIKVKGGALNMHKLVVHFANGDQQEFELRNNFAPGSESRILDLPGNKRVITRVTLWYDSKNMQGKRTLVEVWGRR
jgi:hypothetical protein